MSSIKRNLGGAKTKSESALLDELDSLKDLLDEESEDMIIAAPWEFTPTEASITIESLPELEEAVELTPATQPVRANRPQANIPVLDKAVSTATGSKGGVPELNEVVERLDGTKTETPGSAELLQLVEMLVQRRLDKLKPVLTKEVLQQLERFYPSLKKR